MSDNQNVVIHATDFIANREKYIASLVSDQLLAINKTISEYIYKKPEDEYLNNKSTIASTLIPIKVNPLKDTIQKLNEAGWCIIHRDDVNYLGVNLVSESVNSFLDETQTNADNVTRDEPVIGKVTCKHSKVKLNTDRQLTSNPPKWKARCLDCNEVIYINDNDPRVLIAIFNDPDWSGLRDISISDQKGN